MSLSILYVTHATSLDNEAAVASGHADPPLSELGRARARDLGLHYAGEELRAVDTRAHSD